MVPLGCFRRCSWGAAPDTTIMPLPGLGMNPSFQSRFSPEGGTGAFSRRCWPNTQSLRSFSVKRSCTRLEPDGISQQENAQKVFLRCETSRKTAPSTRTESRKCAPADCNPPCGTLPRTTKLSPPSQLRCFFPKRTSQSNFANTCRLNVPRGTSESEVNPGAVERRKRRPQRRPIVVFIAPLASRGAT